MHCENSISIIPQSKATSSVKTAEAELLKVQATCNVDKLKIGFSTEHATCNVKTAEYGF